MCLRQITFLSPILLQSIFLRMIASRFKPKAKTEHIILQIDLYIIYIIPKKINIKYGGFCYARQYSENIITINLLFIHECTKNCQVIRINLYENTIVHFSL